LKRSIPGRKREHLRKLLDWASGGVVFTTIHNFLPETGGAMLEMNARENVVVIPDESHRSQYGFDDPQNEKPASCLFTASAFCAILYRMPEEVGQIWHQRFVRPFRAWHAFAWSAPMALP
jgi:hypothetical protein